MARTMMSSAFGNSFRNALTRRVRRKETNQRGRPNVPASKAPGSVSVGAPRNRATIVTTMPQMTE